MLFLMEKVQQDVTAFAGSGKESSCASENSLFRLISYTLKPVVLRGKWLRVTWQSYSDALQDVAFWKVYLVILLLLLNRRNFAAMLKQFSFINTFICFHMVLRVNKQLSKRKKFIFSLLSLLVLVFGTSGTTASIINNTITFFQIYKFYKLMHFMSASEFPLYILEHYSFLVPYTDFFFSLFWFFQLYIYFDFQPPFHLHHRAYSLSA